MWSIGGGSAADCSRTSPPRVSSTSIMSSTLALWLLIVCFMCSTLSGDFLDASASQSTHVPNDPVNETAIMHELYNEWINQSKPVMHDFVSKVYTYYQQDAQDAYANNLMGLIHFENQNMSGASCFFKTACEITFFTEEDYVRNYIRAQNLIDFRETMRVLSNALQDDIYNALLIDALYDWLSHAIKYYNYPLTELVRLIIRLPQMHPFWVLFAETVIETPVIPNLTASGIARFALYGLSIFPRSCALHTLRATLYMRENNSLCANQLYQSALRLTHLQRTTFNTTAYLSTLSAYLTAHSIVDMDNTNPTNIAAQTNSACIPHLYHHSTQDYQLLYNTITTTIGTAWTNLSTHHIIPKKRSDMQPIMQFSVNTAHSDYTSDSESSKVRLPSLQVGCSVPIRCARPGFLIADAQETISTHYVTLSHNLSMIESESIGMLYSSHTLEHLSHQLPLATCVSYPKSDRKGDKNCYSELDATLAEWYRVLAYDGLLLLSVPDMAVLTERFQMYKNSTQNMDVMRRILFGGQHDEYDFHKNGFYFEYLKELLVSHKFCEIEKVYQLGLFMDASGTTFTGKEMISLSVRAKKCSKPWYATTYL